jgi:hypothetical protein
MTGAGPDRACKGGPLARQQQVLYADLGTPLQSSAPLMTSGIILLAVLDVPYP